MNSQNPQQVVIRFAGDSGDGMQITGTQFTQTAAAIGNDVQSFPDFPAEIRAPAGTLPGVSGFQLHFAATEIHTPGDQVDVLVAMNPAALKVNLNDLKKQGIVIVNCDSFNDRELKKAQYDHNPLETNDLNDFRVFQLPLTELSINAVADFGLTHSQATKCKNMFALGLVYWLFSRPMESTLQWLQAKFANMPNIAEANIAALKAGYNYALTTEIFTEQYQVCKADLKPGTYRQITGNEALALGCVAAGKLANKTLFMAGYPITPASNILHELASYHEKHVKVFQAEDEIAAAGAALGAAFGGNLAVTCTSGPGLDLKAETIGLAAMTELPMVIVDVQRAGPSTGMPTKTEQSDLMMAIHGRHGECPIPVIAAQSPSDCFMAAIQAFHMALKYMTPVILLSDGAIANGAEPWALDEMTDLPDLTVTHPTDPENFQPYGRDKMTLARNWAIPGTLGLEHRIGGLEKEVLTGNVSYDPDNHQQMTDLRAAKIKGIASSYPPLEVIGEKQGEVLVIGWGCTYGSIRTAVEALQMEGHAISAVHLRNLYPLPNDLPKLLSRFTRIVVAELNSGQLAKLIQSEWSISVNKLNKVTGKPFLLQELKHSLLEHLSEKTHAVQ